MTQNTKIRNERGTSLSSLLKLKDYENTMANCVNKLDNLDKIAKFLQNKKLPKLTKEKMEIMNSSITRKYITQNAHSCTTPNTSPGQMPSPSKLHPIYKEEITPILTNSFRKQRQGNTFRLILWDWYYPFTKGRQRAWENKRSISLMIIHMKIFNIV